MESRIHRKVYVRFGGEYPETQHRNMKLGVGYLAYIENTVGNIFSGQVVGDTARVLSERFGKNVQRRESLSISPEQQSTSYSTQLDSLIPAAKISNLSQGMFAGAITDNFGEEIEQKVFHAKIVVDTAAIAREEKSYVPIPQISFFEDENGEDCMERQIEENYDRIRAEVNQIIKQEMERIKNDPALQHLIPRPRGENPANR